MDGCNVLYQNTKIGESKSKGMREADSFIVENILSINHFLLLEKCKHEKRDYILPNYTVFFK